MPEILPPYPVEPPEYMPGMSLSVMPMTAKHSLWMHDYEYYDQLGRDPLQLRRVWGISDPAARVEGLKEVLEDYPKMMHRRQMLFRAAIRGDEAIVRHLVEVGVRVQPDFEKAKEDEAKEPDVDSGDTELPEKEDETCIPFDVAANRGHIGCLKIFIESGVDVDTRDEFGRTPLIAAAGTNQPEAMKYLLENGADPTARSTDSDFARKWLGMFAGSSALEYIANRGDVETMKMLLERASVEVTPLLVKSAAMGNYEGLKFVLERAGLYPFESKNGDQIKQLPEDMRQAIIDATELAFLQSDLASIKLLLIYQYPSDNDGNISNFEVSDGLRRSVVYGAYDAMKHDYPDKFEWIHSLGVKEHDTMSLNDLPNGQLISIQHLFDDAAMHGSINCARLLIERFGASPHKYRTPPCTFPLYWAACHDKPDFVRFLLEEHSVDIHAGSGRYAAGPTALWTAITHKSFESVKLLLQHGGPLNHFDDEIRVFADSLSAILIAKNDGKVDFQTEDNARSWVDGQKGMWDRPNLPYVRINLTPEDKPWIEKLQMRRSDEELRERGEQARELNEDEKKDDREDWQLQLADYPIVQERVDELDECCDDVIPAFKPAFVAA